MMECQEMTKLLAPHFYSLCDSNKLEREYYKIAAAMAGFILIQAGTQQRIVEPVAAENLLFYYIIAGSKTIPYQAALWINNHETTA
jgi:hypothetical protein